MGTRPPQVLHPDIRGWVNMYTEVHDDDTLLEMYPVVTLLAC